MYCPSYLHDSHSLHYTLEKLQKQWLDVYEKTQKTKLRYKICFTGGEVTTNKDFLPFIKWLKSDFLSIMHQILVTTNGSASLKYYCKLYEFVDNISFSFHSEHADEKDFFGKMVELKTSVGSDRLMHVNIMDEFWNSERIPNYLKILQEHDISYSVNEINYAMKTRSEPVFKGKFNLEF
jgi:hypothetical protein